MSCVHFVRYNTRLSGVSLPLSASEQHLTMGLRESRIVVPDDWEYNHWERFSMEVTDDGYVFVTDELTTQANCLIDETQEEIDLERQMAISALPPTPNDPVSV